jgi:hypothetical protein
MGGLPEGDGRGEETKESIIDAVDPSEVEMREALDDFTAAISLDHKHGRAYY